VKIDYLSHNSAAGEEGSSHAVEKLSADFDFKGCPDFSACGINIADVRWLGLGVRAQQKSEERDAKNGFMDALSPPRSLGKRLRRILIRDVNRTKERLLSRPAATLSSIRNGGEGWGEEALRFMETIKDEGITGLRARISKCTHRF